MPNRVRDLTGLRFGRLVAIDRAPTINKATYWNVGCDCGTVCAKRMDSLIKSDARSCGCLRVESAKAFAEMATRHGHSRAGKRSPEMIAYEAMRGRCENPGNASFSIYGAQGIEVCDEWRADFVAFLKHVGIRPGPKYSLDRIDGTRGYEPGNVRWATWHDQIRNRKNTIWVTPPEGRMTLGDYARLRRVRYDSLLDRIKRRGDDPVQAADWLVNNYRPLNRA